MAPPGWLLPNDLLKCNFKAWACFLNAVGRLVRREGYSSSLFVFDTGLELFQCTIAGVHLCQQRHGSAEHTAQTVLRADTALRERREMKGKSVYKVRRLSLVHLSHPMNTGLALAAPGWTPLL